MTRRPWWTKLPNKRESLRRVTNPDNWVYVDYIESTTTGFIDQLRVSVTNQRYHSSKIFIYHYSDLRYFLQKILTLKTFQYKKAFEAYIKKVGVTAKHYHADNEIFQDNIFIQEIRNERQTIYFYGFNLHYRNGKAENRIGYLQDQKRKQIYHAK